MELRAKASKLGAGLTFMVTLCVRGGTTKRPMWCMRSAFMRQAIDALYQGSHKRERVVMVLRCYAYMKVRRRIEKCSLAL